MMRIMALIILCFLVVEPTLAQDTSKKAILIVNNADDRLKVWVNDGLIYDSGENPYDTSLDIRVDFTDKLQPGNNIVKVEGWNLTGHPDPKGNPWHFKYKIYWDGRYIIDVNERSPGPESGWVYKKMHRVYLSP